MIGPPSVITCSVVRQASSVVSRGRLRPEARVRVSIQCISKPPREFDGLRYPNLAPHKLRDPLGRIAAADLFSDVGVSGLVGLDHADPGMGADVGGVGGHAASPRAIEASLLRRSSM